MMTGATEGAISLYDKRREPHWPSRRTGRK